MCYNNIPLQDFSNLMDLIKKTDKVLLFTHLNPDGDALGSLLSMNIGLRSLGIETHAIIIDKVSHDLDFLPQVSELELLDDFIKDKHVLTEDTLAIALDVADKFRLGDCEPLFASVENSAQFDHHPTNVSFTKYNYVDGKACATAIIINRFFEYANITINIDMAITMYTALATDTGNFSYSNSNSETFAVMSKLTTLDWPIDYYSDLLFRKKSYIQEKVLAEALSTLHLSNDGKQADICLTYKQIESYNATGEHTQGIVNYALDIEEVCIAFFMHETVDGTIRCALRSKNPYRVDEIAVSHGGGGHRQASGCALKGPIEIALSNLRLEVKNAIKAVEKNNKTNE